MATQVPVAEELAAKESSLARRSPQEILSWAVEAYFPRLTMATAFGAEGCCLIHMLAEIERAVHIFNLETGYQFPETLAQAVGRSRSSIAEYEAEHGGPLYRIRPDQCCHDRKVLPLRRHLVGYEAWISAIRGDQTRERATASVIGWDAKFNLLKINPLLNWTRNDVWSFIARNDVPYNPLHDRNYPSIGCWPCTQPVADGEDERAGRWAGTGKKECGLHVIEHQGGSGI